MRIETFENRFLNEFIGFMESPLDESCIIHSEPQAFYESYEMYLNEYVGIKARAEDAKKRKISILNYHDIENKDELLAIGVYQSYQDLSHSIDNCLVDLRKNVSENGRRIHALIRAIK